MNQTIIEMRAILEGDQDAIAHYGMPRRSGRYPWGSGKDPYQRTGDFLSRVSELKKQGLTETEIAKELGFVDKKTGKTQTGRLRDYIGICRDERVLIDVARAKSLKEDGLGPTEIGRIMTEERGRNISESTVRSWLNPDVEANALITRNTVDFIRDQIDKKGMVMVGKGVEKELGVSEVKFNQALTMLEAEGYPVYNNRVPQIANPNQSTTLKVICPPGTPYKNIYKFDQLNSLNDYISHDNGDTYEKKFTYPASMDSKRLQIRYADDVGPDGVKGVQKDGVIELRRGVADLSLGEKNYSQVRILVDNDRYLKGMAVYSDNMPDGVDVIFNTNKSSDVPMKDVLKKIKDDPENPFGSAIKDSKLGGQYWYEDEDGTKKLGLINKRADEGDWTEWKDSIPSQFLSKQSLQMAKKQLNLAVVDKRAEYDEICSKTNPTVKKYLLKKFSDECDSAAVHLQAAALPGQKYHVILPINSLKDNEIYAPGYEPGTKLALVRYPHGGTFEIPILTVNNKNKDGVATIGKQSIDAVGINSKVAGMLSGADFDGDTVMCIPTHDPNGKIKITSTVDTFNPKIPLKGFDPTFSYGPEKVEVDSNGKEHYYRNGREYKIMSEEFKQKQMGVASNLICDMTLLSATDDEKAAAVRHSMVVIDAVKHKLDYRQSEVDNNIAALKKKYQTGGASTLISRSKGQHTVDKRQGNPIVNIEGKANYRGKDYYDPDRPEGALIWKPADDLTYEVTRTDKNTGEVTTVTKKRTQTSTNMAETDDAFTLISDRDTPMERAYADYANKMKALANQSRKEMMNTGKIEYDRNAKTTYREEVSSLLTKLNTAELNAPRERIATIKANASVESRIQAIMDDNPGMTRKEAKKKVDVKKVGAQALNKHREEVGAVSRRDRSINITDREWEAIQAGAVSENVLNRILNNSDIDRLRDLATPKARTTISAAQGSRIKALMASNYTIEQIATRLNMSTSTLYNYLKGVKS